MSSSSRRAFLALSGAGAAAVAAAAVAPAAAGASASPGPQGRGSQGSPGSFVAYIADGTSGELALMVGEREVLVHDPDLVARLQGHLV